MGVMAAALDLIRSQCLTAGIRAETDPRNVNAPGAWITVENVTHGATLDGARVRVNVYLVVPNTGTEQSLADLDDMLDRLTRVIDPDAPTTPTQIALPDGSELPAVRVTVDVY